MGKYNPTNLYEFDLLNFDDMPECDCEDRPFCEEHDILIWVDRICHEYQVGAFWLGDGVTFSSYDVDDLIKLSEQIRIGHTDFPSMVEQSPIYRLYQSQTNEDDWERIEI